MTTRSGLVEGCDAVALQILSTASTLGLSALIRLDGSPVLGESESVSTAWTWGPAPMAKSVSVAVGESETMHWGFELPAAPAKEPPNSGKANAPKKSVRTKRRVLNMDISFPSKWDGRRMDIRTTAPYLESCLSNLLAEGDLAMRASHEGHLQLRDSVGISPTSLPRGVYDFISRERPGSANRQAVATLRQRASSPSPRQCGLGPALTLPYRCRVMATLCSLSQRGPSTAPDWASG